MQFPKFFLIFAFYKIMEKTDRIKVPAFTEENGFSTTDQRRKIMSRIRSKDTKPEIEFRKALWSRGIRYRTCSKSLPGKPDVASANSRFAVFIDGEFWHGYDWENKKEKIKTNREFWIPKIERNMQRATEVNDELAKMGIKVFRFWSGEIKKNIETCVDLVVGHVLSNKKTKTSKININKK